MFSLGFSHRKGVFIKKALPLFLAFCFVVTLFSGCDTAGAGDTGSLVGTWEWSSPDYSYTVDITSETVVYEGSYEGTIKNDPDFTARDGVLIIQFTKYADFGSDLSTSHENIGKYGALYWKELTSSSVYLADAYTGPDHVLYDDLDTASANFTNDTVGNYINWGGTAPLTK